MLPTDFFQALERRPFEPFRIQVSDGTVYEIMHPELVMVGLGSLIIGKPAVGQMKPVFEYAETVSLTHIVKLLPMSAATKESA